MVAALVMASRSAAAQPAKAPAPPAPPAAPPAAAPPPVAPPVPKTADEAKASLGADDPIVKALAPRSGGLTLDQIAKGAAKNKASVRVKQAELRAAAARVDQALIAFFPRVSVTAQFSALSEVRNSFGSFGNGALVGAANEGLLRVGPCIDDPTRQCVVDSASMPVGAQKVGGLDLPVVTHFYQFVFTLAVPVSDYVLRLSQSYAASSKQERAKKLEVEAELLQIEADARIAYLQWARAKGNVVIAEEAEKTAKAHLEDVKRLFEAGLATKADVSRLEAQVAGAHQLVVEAKSFVDISEEQIRTLMGSPAGTKLELGSDLLGQASAPPSESLDKLQLEAMKHRLEIRALDETVYSLKEVESITRAGYFPRVDAVANVIVANPNQRVFPQADKWDATWDAGVRITWTLNDIALTAAQVAEAKARTASVAEQKAALKDGLRLEVAAAYAEAVRASAARESAERALVAALESLAQQTDLFKRGKGTTVAVLDAEGEVVRARLRALDAQVGLIIARTKLEHATGRDVAKSGAAKPAK